MKSLKLILFATVALLWNGCNRMTFYEMDTNPFAYRNQSLLDYFESGADPTCTMFCQAVRLAGIESELAAANRTVVIPNNTAFAAYLTQAGVANVADISPAVLRDLLLYMIVPGDYRVTVMEAGKNYECTSLRGEPLTIGRHENPKTYRVVINAVSDMESITVEQQDYLFKDNVIGQVVKTMPLYKKTLPATSSKPEGYVPGEVASKKIELTHDTFIFGYGTGGKASNYDGNALGIRLFNRSNYYAYGLMRFPLPQDEDTKNLISDLVSAQLGVTLYNLGGLYPTETTGCKITVSEPDPKVLNQWEESTVTWNNLVVDVLGNSHTKLLNTLAGELEFVSPGPSTEMALNIDITPSVLKLYGQGTTSVDYVVYNQSAKVNASGAEMYLKDKDYHQFTSFILLVGPSTSPLTAPKEVTLNTTGYSTIFDHNTLQIVAPSDPGEFDFSAKNIMLRVSEVPTKGTLTLYGTPVPLSSKFTYLEMQRGYVKYIRNEQGEDHFKLKVLDYLDGMTTNQVSVTVK